MKFILGYGKKEKYHRKAEDYSTPATLYTTLLL
jgi:hypothetical protein